MRQLYIILLIACSYISTAQHTNILISQSNNPEEPSICINPLNTDIIVAGANINNCYNSNDGGITWSKQTLSSTFGVWGDPVIVSDKNGDFYFFHLSNPTEGSWLDRIVCQKSTDNGVTWNDGTFMGVPGSKDHDKQWASVDFKNNIIYLTWTMFDYYGSSNPDDKSNILFSKSEDNGATWSVPKQINKLSGDCIDEDLTTEGAVPAVGPNGEIYVAWAYNNKLYFDKSLDAGDTWLENDIEIGSQPDGWDYTIPGIDRCNGLPITCCDTSPSSYRGNIYVNWTDQRNGANDTDVWFAKSSDGGNTWSEAKKVNNDETNTHQFLTWMTIDQSNGYIYFVFYDRRNHSDNHTDVYMAVSKDGGETFDNFKVSEKPFLPNASVFFGDYTNISAYNNIVRPIWARLHYGDGENGLSIWTALIDTEVTHANIASDLYLDEYLTYPNPSNEISYFSFKLKRPSYVKLSLYNASGKLVKQLVDENRGAGKYIEEFNVKNENLPAGIYFYSLTTNKKITSKKLIIQKE